MGFKAKRVEGGCTVFGMLRGLDALCTFYPRRSGGRFWGGGLGCISCDMIA
jgi:hypothetical protein